MSSDPNSYIQDSAKRLAETLASKNSDYAPTGEFSNFEKAAEIADIKAIQVMASQLAIKVTRIQSLMERNGDEYNHESLKDSFLDAAGYATIAHAYLEHSGEADEPHDYRSAAHERMVEVREEIRNTSWEDDPALAKPFCFHNWVEARGEMDEGLGYTICGFCGVRRV